MEGDLVEGELEVGSCEARNAGEDLGPHLTDWVPEEDQHQDTAQACRWQEKLGQGSFSLGRAWMCQEKIKGIVL